MMNRLIVLALAALAGAGALGLSQPKEPASAPTTKPAQPTPKRPGDLAPAGRDLNELWLAPGSYSAIVISTTATERTWWLSLDTTKGSFPVTIGPQQTITLTFNPPWVVKVDDNARLTSKYVPFGEYADFNPLNNQRVQLFAWGVTPGGPVPLVPPNPTKTKSP